MKGLRTYLSALFLALTLITVVGCASTTSKEGTSKYFDDIAITTKVEVFILETAIA